MKTRETKRRNGFRAMAFLVAALPFGAAFAAAPVAPRDVVIYGSSPAALTAAIEARRRRSPSRATVPCRTCRTRGWRTSSSAKGTSRVARRPSGSEGTSRFAS